MESTQEIETKSAFLTTLHLALLSFLIALPVFSGFDLASSTRFGIFLTINILCGQYVWSKLLINHNPSIFESLAAGLALGTSIPAVINIGIRLIGLFGFSTGYIFPIACIFGWLVFDRKLPQLSASTNKRDDQDFRILLATPLLAIVAWNPHAWPFCASYIIGSFVLWKYEKRASCFRCIAHGGTKTTLLILFTVTISRFYSELFLDQPIWRQFLGTDAAWDEGAAWSLAEFGPNKNLMFSGQVIRGHFLTQSWAGDLASSVFAPQFLSTGIPSFAIGIAGVSLAIYTITSTLHIGRLVSVVAAIVLVTQASLPEELMLVAAPRYANSMALFYLAFFWYVYFTVHNFKYQQRYALLVFLIVIITLSKLHFGAITVCSMVIFEFAKFVKEKKREHLVLIASTLLVFISTFQLFINGISNTQPADYSIDLMYGIFLMSLLVTRLPFLNFLFSRKLNQKTLIVLFLINTSVMMIVTFFTKGQNSSIYLFQPVLLFAAIFLAIYISSSTIKDILTLPSLVHISLGIAVGLITNFIYLYLHYRISEDIHSIYLVWIFQKYPYLIQIGSVIFLVGLIYLLSLVSSKFRQNKNGFAPLLLLAPLLILGMNFGNWLAHPFKSSIAKIWYDISFSSEEVFNEDQFLIGKWISENTNHESLIASNYFCEESENNQPIFSSQNDCASRNTFGWISTLGQRQVLIEMPEWVTSGPYAQRDELINLFLDKANSFSGENFNETLQDLISLGVTHFIWDIRKAGPIDNGINSKIIYRNSSYVLFHLV